MTKRGRNTKKKMPAIQKLLVKRNKNTKTFQCVFESSLWINVKRFRRNITILRWAFLKWNCRIFVNRMRFNSIVLDIVFFTLWNLFCVSFFRRCVLALKTYVHFIVSNNKILLILLNILQCFHFFFFSFK